MALLNVDPTRTQGAVYSVQFSRTGEIIVSGSRDETVRVWLARTGQLVSVLKVKCFRSMFCFAVSPALGSLSLLR